ncbi:hypothetical protein [Actinomyces provencensis]|uniref:hypothetical protein n=1 Tax=Actinomyces provencensis TaxID=1720198 RepID=UPI00117739BB|nr:hypothetical protein [Actinomyces provencensis]
MHLGGGGMSGAVRVAVWLDADEAAAMVALAERAAADLDTPPAEWKGLTALRVAIQRGEVSE